MDGKIVAAAQEERFTRKKHDPEFPIHAIDYCLEEAGLKPETIDYVGFYDKPFLKFERLLETYLSFAPSGFRSFTLAMPLWLRQKLRLPREMNRGLKQGYRKRYIFCKHHESHAASAFFPSPFEEAAILTMDGVGEWATTTLGSGRGNRIELSHELRFPHSLGLLYSAFTYFTGFRVNSGEYKLMGLAPYGEPRYVDLILEKLLDLKEDGSFRMDLSYFNYCQGLTMTSKKFDRLFGRPPRQPETPVTESDMDLAASIQKVTEEIMLRSASHLHELTGLKNLCLAGGVALNCVGNGRIQREGPFENVWIQPAAGDAGGALGVALLIWHQLLDHPREVEQPDGQMGSLLGPRFGDQQIRQTLSEAGAVYHHFADEDELCRQVAALLDSQQVVGWMQGRMEFGPRALGARSIIGDARDQEMQTVMNVKIKFRESFRPFAPSVLGEQAAAHFEMETDQTRVPVSVQAAAHFEMETDQTSPYMLLVAPVQPSQRLQPGDESRQLKGLKKLKGTRSRLPAITHVDYSARVQTVDETRNPRYHKLIQAFEQKTGCPVIINTSFNVRGEPIVCTPAEAYHCFMGTQMDVLVVGNFLLHKKEQPKSELVPTESYISQFEMD